MQQGLRVVEAECRLVAAGFAARLRDERRDEGLAAAAVAAAKGRLAQLAIEVAAAEGALIKLQEARAEQEGRVPALERVERECGARAAQAEQELGGYPEPLRLLEAEDEEEAGATEAEGEQGAARNQRAQRKRKRAGEAEPGTAVSKRRHGGCSSTVDWETLMQEGLEWYIGDNFRVMDRARGQLLIETAAAGGLRLAVGWCAYQGWGGYRGDADDKKAAFDAFREVAAADGGATWVVLARVVLASRINVNHK